MKKAFDGCIFFVEPIGELSNRRLAELLDQRTYEDEQRDQLVVNGGPHNVYEVSAAQLVQIFMSARGTSALVFNYFVRFKRGESLNPVQLVPDRDLGSIKSLATHVGTMLKKIGNRYRMRPPSKKTFSRGTFPMNCLRQEGAT